MALVHFHIAFAVEVSFFPYFCNSSGVTPEPFLKSNVVIFLPFSWFFDLLVNIIKSRLIRRKMTKSVMPLPNTVKCTKCERKGRKIFVGQFDFSC